jgi:endonuclease/exonuclease/phosphatase family metal-dependent hydrolase
MQETATGRAVVRVLTWNIHGGIGADGIRNLTRVVELVQRHDPDIVALQEIDSRGGRVEDESAFAFLGRCLGEHCVEAHAIAAPDGHYGHAVISRWPIARSRLHDISVDGREPRRAIEATIETESGPLHLVAAHLGLAFSERRRQAQTLATLADAAPATSVFAGDFNDWFRRGAVTAALSRAFPARTEHPTFPARLPVLQLDRIYCRPAGALARSWTDRAAARASDHLPVVADIVVGG